MHDFIKKKLYLSFNDSQMQMLCIYQCTAELNWISCWFTALAAARLFNDRLFHLWIHMKIITFC